MTTKIIYLKVILKSQSGNPRIKIDIPFGFFVDAGVLWLLTYGYAAVIEIETWKKKSFWSCEYEIVQILRINFVPKIWIFLMKWQIFDLNSWRWAIVRADASKKYVCHAPKNPNS